MSDRITALWLFDEAAASAGVAESALVADPWGVRSVDECLWCAMVLQVLDLVNSAHEAFYGDCPATSAFSIDSSSVANTSTLLSGNMQPSLALMEYSPWKSTLLVTSNFLFYSRNTVEISQIANNDNGSCFTARNIDSSAVDNIFMFM